MFGAVYPGQIYPGQSYPVYAGGSPTLEQSAFRFRNDDGSEAAATWAAAQNANHSVAQGVTVRLRVQVNGSNDPASALFQLEYRVSGSSDPWSVVS